MPQLAFLCACEKLYYVANVQRALKFTLPSWYFRHIQFAPEHGNLFYSVARELQFPVPYFLLYPLWFSYIVSVTARIPFCQYYRLLVHLRWTWTSPAEQMLQSMQPFDVCIFTTKVCKLIFRNNLFCWNFSILVTSDVTNFLTYTIMFRKNFAINCPLIKNKQF